jgi:hypothetical protein
MVNIERPCCDTPLAVELPLPDAIRCDECAVSWSIADPATESAHQVALAA